MRPRGWEQMEVLERAIVSSVGPQPNPMMKRLREPSNCTGDGERGNVQKLNLSDGGSVYQNAGGFLPNLKWLPRETLNERGYR